MQTTDSAAASYDLTVLGPNGFLRRFAGLASSTSSADVTACYEVKEGDLEFTLINNARVTNIISLKDNRYGTSTQTVTLPAASSNSQPWSLSASQRWYDISITSNLDPLFLRQFSGYVEIGNPGVTDPAMA
jgi:phospholipase C